MKMPTTIPSTACRPTLAAPSTAGLPTANRPVRLRRLPDPGAFAGACLPGPLTGRAAQPVGQASRLSLTSKEKSLGDSHQPAEHSRPWPQAGMEAGDRRDAGPTRWTACAALLLLLALPAAVQAQTGPDSPLALADALNNTNLVWSTSGATNWFSQTNTTHDGISAARSGAITNSQSSTLQTTVTGPGTLSFWWKVSSQTNYDWLQFKVGTVTNSTLSGEVNWQQRTVYLGAGAQTLQWLYLKDSSGYSGQDAAWLDEVNWALGATPPTITVQPVGTTNLAGLSYTLCVAAVGTPSLSYQWQLNGINLAGAAGTNLALGNLQAGNAGAYRVVITNAYGLATSAVATVSVTPSGPVITSQPQSRGAALGQDVAVGVSVRGTEPLTYQWRKDGTDMVGATGTVLPLPSFQAGDAGVYQVVVSNALGTATSTAATFGVVPVIAWGLNDFGQTNVPEHATNVLALSAGYLHNLVLRADGSVVAWGSSFYGLIDVPAGASNNMAVAAGGYHSLALRADGTVVAWGYNESGQTNVPPSATNIVAVAAGGYHSLAKRADGSVLAWGRGSNGQTTVPASATNIIAVAAGGFHSLALRLDRTVVAWGYNAYGQTNVPVSATNILAIAAGYYHSLALRADGTVVAWGEDGSGQANVPANATNIVTVAAGQIHSLALRADGSMVAWGNGSLGGGRVPLIATNAIAIASGRLTSLALLATAFAPNVVLHPAERTAYIGSTVTMIGAVNGGAPMQYQWRCNGTNLLEAGRFRGISTPALTILGALAADSGAYNMVVSNRFGSVTSSVVALSVVVANITTQPLSQTNLAGTTAIFSIAAEGPGPLRYQWQFNGTNLAGASSTNLTLVNVQPNNAGIYQVVITNAYGSVTSSVVVLTVLLTPDSPLALANAVNSTNLTWSTSGATNWFSQTNTTHDGVSAARSGVITNSQSSTLQTTVTGPGTLSYWWKVSSQTNYDLLQFKVGTSTSSTLSGEVDWQQRIAYLGAGAQTLQWVYLKDASSYSGQDAAWLDEVSWVPGSTLPTITAQPVGTNLSAGLSYTLRVVAVGTPMLSYQWQFNGTNLAGATATNLSLANLQAANAGGYRVVITNGFGSVTSQVASITVIPSAPVITSQPQSRGAALGQDVGVGVLARGTEPLSYQWLKNGTNVPGGTGAALPLPNFQAEDAGMYQVVVSNAVGTATSSAATLGAVPVIAWGNNGNGQTNVPVAATNVVAVAAGYYHNLALRADAIIVGWGHNSYGQTTVPFSATNVVALAGGFYHSLALRADGSVIAWGYNNYGQTTVPPSATNVVAVAAGNYHSLALRADGTAIAWGYNYYGQTNVPANATNVMAVAAGSYHNLALRSGGTVIAWGYNYYGQTNVPLSATNVVAVAAGYYHSLALRSDGTVIAWGYNNYGQTNVPPSATNVVAVAAGYYHSLALRADGTVIAWGYNNSGQTNVPASATNGVAIGAGYAHSLALLASSLFPTVVLPMAQRTAYAGDTVTLVAAASGGLPLQYQWRCNGTNLVDGRRIRGAQTIALTIQSAQLGDAGLFSLVVSNAYGSVTSSVVVLTVEYAPPLAATQVAGPVTQTAATLNGLAVPSGSAAVAWFEWGTDASYGEVTAPVSVGSGWAGILVRLPVAGLSPGATYHYRLVVSNQCAMVRGMDACLTTRPTGLKVTPWGYSAGGNTKVPPGLSNVVAIAGGHGHSMALLANGTVSVWGDDYGRNTQTNVPASLSNVIAIGSGFSHCLAVKADGFVAVWGKYYDGSVVTVPSNLSNVVAVAGGDYHSLALKADGSVTAWGSGVATNVPGNLSGIVAIAAGSHHNLALRADGTVLTWGQGYGIPLWLSNVLAVASQGYYDLALRSDGTVAAWGYNSSYGEAIVPVGLSNVVAIAAGYVQSIALRVDGTVVVWGDNRYGQRNVPPGLSNVTAIATGDQHCFALGPNIAPTSSALTIQGGMNQDLVAPVSFADINGDLLTYRVASLPAGGSLYQYTTNGRGAPITAAGTLLTDSKARCIFAPLVADFGAPYDSFSLVANDGEADSPPGLVTVNIVPAPVIPVAGLGRGTNGSFQLSFPGLSNLTYSVWASTNLTGWTLLGSATQTTPGQFCYTDATATNSPLRFYRVRSP